MRLLLIIFFCSLSITIFSQEIPCDSTKKNTCVVYDSSGQKILKANYKSGQRHGIWIEYADGIVVKKTKYKNGMVRWIYLYKDGRLAETIDRKGKRRKMKNCGC